LNEKRGDVDAAVKAYNEYMSARHVVISNETLERAEKIESQNTEILEISRRVEDNMMSKHDYLSFSYVL